MVKVVPEEPPIKRSQNTALICERLNQIPLGVNYIVKNGSFVKIIQDTWFSKISYMNGMIMTLYDPDVWACEWVANGYDNDASFSNQIA